MDLEERYPELAIAAHLFSSGEEVTWKKWEKPVNSKANVIYLYGFSPYIDPFIKWLEEDANRDLIILEDRIEAIGQIQELSVEFLSHLQVHLKYVPDQESLASVVSQFPFAEIEVYSLQENEEKFREIEKLLHRNVVLEEAIYQEMLHYPKLARNLFSNFSYWEEAFDLGKWKGAFQNVPAIYVGAGPSLKSVTAELKNLGDRALLLAGGSAITALGNQGISPHLMYAIDPNGEEFTRLAFQSCFDAPLIYGTRLCPEVFYSHGGPLGYFVTGTGGGIETWFEKEVGISDPKILENLSQEALSVTTIALMSAIYMGCNPIILLGVDLAYSNGARYTEGVVSDMQCTLEEKDKHASLTVFVEGEYTTCTKWIMERDVLDDMAKKHPHVQFLRGTQGGIPFTSIPYDQNWSEKIQQSMSLRERVEVAIRSSYLGVSQEKIGEAKEKFAVSLRKCRELIDEILAEYAKIYPNLEGKDGTVRSQVLEMDLEEEVAYDIALKIGSYALSLHYRREARQNTPRNLYLIKTEIYRKLKSIIEEYLIFC